MAQRAPVPKPASSADKAASRITGATHNDPHGFLGAHPDSHGVVVRAYHPEAAACTVLLEKREVPMQAEGGVFVAHLPKAKMPLAYRLRWDFHGGAPWECDDPYRFGPTFGDLDAHLFNEGQHRRLWEALGAHPRSIEGVAGVSFSVWAPNAVRASVVGDFCQWDGRRYPMRSMGSSGVFELFIPGLAVGELYKFELRSHDGRIIVKTDPMARAMEIPPDTASRVERSSYVWQDAAYIARRRNQDARRRPLAIYEVHLGSWARVPEQGNRPLSYREAATKLVEHVKDLGFNAIELLPVTEHPFTGSWGYQVSGYYAPTSRYGTPDDLRYFIDMCHQSDVAVIMDWVPAHFPKDAFALAQFDGTALYEHADPRRGEHPDWGTLIFNYGRNEVRNFLVANALYWLEEFHIDGLRVDAVASMLYLDYSRKPGEWLPNAHGGRENLEAMEFIKHLNGVVHSLHADALMIAEESTAWPGVTQPTEHGGLGFTFKWNMGWMHDSLEYFKLDPIHRRFHQDQLSFAMVYENNERFVMPLSHDEVVHGKGSLLSKMPGDAWQKFANLRLLYAYMFTRPGKKLLFMGSELAPETEWNHDQSLDWHLGDDPQRQALQRFLRSLTRLYHDTPCLWQNDPDHTGFFWIDHHDHHNSVMAYARQAAGKHIITVLNLTPVPRPGYRIGVPHAGTYSICLSSDDALFGGSDFANPPHLTTVPTAWHGQPQSVVLSLPPLAALVLAPDL